MNKCVAEASKTNLINQPELGLAARYLKINPSSCFLFSFEPSIRSSLINWYTVTINFEQIRFAQFVDIYFEHQVHIELP